MKTGKTLVKEFIKNNGLDFSGSGSDLNGNCVILAGFICHIVLEHPHGYKLIESLGFSREANQELLRVFDFAYDNNYGDFWETPEAKEKYKFE